MTLDELLAVYRRHLYLPDPSPLLAVLATIVANRLDGGDAVWLLLVGPPSSGKTELLNAVHKLDDVHVVSTFTEAGLLSGAVSRRPGATGGLLAQMGGQGILCLKDFTSFLSEAAETRRGLIAALREVYDGSWVRHLGSEGGRSIGWTGKAGLVGAVTETIDSYAAVMGSMGERFALCRMPELDDEGRLAQARKAFDNAGRQVTMREELAQATEAFLDGVTLPAEPEPIDEMAKETFVRLADLATRCRSTVERDERTREVELVPQPECAARLQAVLVQLTRALWTIGVNDEATQRLVVKIALDGTTKARARIIRLMARTPPMTFWTAAQVADQVGMPTAPIGRALDDLAAHAVVNRHAEQTPYRWAPSDWFRQRWHELKIDESTAGGDLAPSAQEQEHYAEDDDGEEF